MTRFAFIRHGRTAWNEAGRVQGHTDIPLSDEGRSDMGARTYPPDLAEARWFTSPLSRARETAALLGVSHATVDDRLKETSWGDWEGMTFDQMVAQHPEAMARRKQDRATFKAPGGETLVEVQARVQTWIAEQIPQGGTVAAVAHRGLIRCVLALTDGWTLQKTEPVEMNWLAAHYLKAAPDGTLAIERLNVSLPLKP